VYVEVRHSDELVDNGRQSDSIHITQRGVMTLRRGTGGICPNILEIHIAVSPLKPSRQLLDIIVMIADIRPGSKQDHVELLTTTSALVVTIITNFINCKYMYFSVGLSMLEETST
jgi:hypothetical protein